MKVQLNGLSSYHPYPRRIKCRYCIRTKAIHSPQLFLRSRVLVRPGIKTGSYIGISKENCGDGCTLEPTPLNHKQTVINSRDTCTSGLLGLAIAYSLLERNEARRMCGTDTRSSVLYRLVCDGELSQVMAHHLWLQI